MLAFGKSLAISAGTFQRGLRSLGSLSKDRGAIVYGTRRSGLVAGCPGGSRAMLSTCRPDQEFHARYYGANQYVVSLVAPDELSESRRCIRQRRPQGALAQSVTVLSAPIPISLPLERRGFGRCWGRSAWKRRDVVGRRGRILQARSCPSDHRADARWCRVPRSYHDHGCRKSSWCAKSNAI